MRDSYDRIKKYYDSYGSTYDDERLGYYYSLINKLEFEKLRGYIKDKKILEVGCGTGIILNEATKLAKEAIGIDQSDGMLKQAIKKGLKVKKASAVKLPFKANSFDVTYSFKVLPHIPDIKKVLKEITRVTKNGGYIIIEFYNPYSFKYLANKLSSFFVKKKIYVRYDNYSKVKSYLPTNLKIIDIRGVRIFTPISYFLRIPILSQILRRLESLFCDSCLKFFGGYWIVVLKNEK